MNNENRNDDVQHGIDDSPNNDPGKGAALGGVGGAVVGGLAGGPIGAVVGAIAGAAASGAGVAAVDRVDNDNTVTGAGAEDAHRSDENMTGVPMNERTTGYDSAVADPHDYQTSGSEVSGISNTGEIESLNLPQVSREEYDRLSVDERQRVQLAEEQLHVNKQERQAGEVEISKRVVEEQVEVPVTLEREEVVIHRHAVDGTSTAGAVADAFEDDTITIPIREEVANVTKEARVVEEVEIEKRTVAEQQTVRDTVRHEEIDLNSAGNVRVDGNDRI